MASNKRVLLIEGKFRYSTDKSIVHLKQLQKKKKIFYFISFQQNKNRGKEKNVFR